MKNPWLDVPLEDYEAHMAFPGIEQAQLISDILAGVIDQYCPGSIAIVGCAGGNGFERIPSSVSRVVGVDVNPYYVGAAKTRFAGRLTSLELIVGDIEDDGVSFAPCDLVFLGLILEYVDVPTVLGRIPSMLTADGHLVTVLQLSSSGHAQVSPSPFASIQSLGKIMHLVEPSRVMLAAETHGLVEMEFKTVTSVGGKRFHVQSFAMPPNPSLHRTCADSRAGR